MKKYKKIIIIFSLILSVLFLNINTVTPVYCATTIVNVNITDFNGNTDDLSFYYKYPLGKFKTYGVREIDGITYLSLTYSASLLSSDYDYLSLYCGDEPLEIESISSSGSEIFIIPIFKTTEEETESTETTETTESTETTTEETENTEENNNNIVVDNTEVLAELKEIKSYLLMFFATYFLISGYKIIKETVRKEKKL